MMSSISAVFGGATFFVFCFSAADLPRVRAGENAMARPSRSIAGGSARVPISSIPAARGGSAVATPRKPRVCGSAISGLASPRPARTSASARASARSSSSFSSSSSSSSSNDNTGARCLRACAPGDATAFVFSGSSARLFSRAPRCELAGESSGVSSRGAAWNVRSQPGSAFRALSWSGGMVHSRRCAAASQPVPAAAIAAFSLSGFNNDGKSAGGRRARARSLRLAAAFATPTRPRTPPRGKTDGARASRA